MKKVSFYSLLSLFITFYAHSQTVNYRNGGMLYEGKVLRKSDDILPILQGKFTPELIKSYEKYGSNRSLSSASFLVGSISTGYYLGRVSGGGEGQKAFLYAGIGSYIAGILIGISANKNMKEVVRLYNSNLKQVTFEPIFKNDNSFNEMGIAIKF
jgi:hypothetical protein